MKASILTSEVNLAANEQSDLRGQWMNLFRKLKEFLSGSFESDWEEKTGLDWQEWGKPPCI